MKFYLDEDLSPKIADILRKRKVDCTSAHVVGMTQASDLQQLQYASKEKRCLVTRNRDDFIRLTVQFFNDNRHHHGVLIVPHTIAADNFALIATLLEKYATKHSRSEHVYTINFLSVESYS